MFAYFICVCSCVDVLSLNTSDNDIHVLPVKVVTIIIVSATLFTGKTQNDALFL